LVAAGCCSQQPEIIFIINNKFHFKIENAEITQRKKQIREPTPPVGLYGIT
jgi:hypothetical protein